MGNGYSKQRVWLATGILSLTAWILAIWACLEVYESWKGM